MFLPTALESLATRLISVPFFFVRRGKVTFWLSMVSSVFRTTSASQMVVYLPKWTCFLYGLRTNMTIKCIKDTQELRHTTIWLEFTGCLFFLRIRASVCRKESNIEISGKKASFIKILLKNCLIYFNVFRRITANTFETYYNHLTTLFKP